MTQLSDQGHRSRQVKVVGYRGPEPLLQAGRMLVNGAMVAGPIREPGPQLTQSAVRAGKAVGAEVELGAVLGLQGEVSKCERVETLVGELADSKEVARRLRHPRPGEKEQASMQPAANHAVACD